MRHRTSHYDELSRVMRWQDGGNDRLREHDAKHEIHRPRKSAQDMRPERRVRKFPPHSAWTK